MAGGGGSRGLPPGNFVPSPREVTNSFAIIWFLDRGDRLSKLSISTLSDNFIPITFLLVVFLSIFSKDGVLTSSGALLSRSFEGGFHFFVGGFISEKGLATAPKGSSQTASMKLRIKRSESSLVLSRASRTRFLCSFVASALTRSKGVDSECRRDILGTESLVEAEHTFSCCKLTVGTPMECLRVGNEATIFLFWDFLLVPCCFDWDAGCFRLDLPSDSVDGRFFCGVPILDFNFEAPDDNDLRFFSGLLDLELLCISGLPVLDFGFAASVDKDPLFFVGLLFLVIAFEAPADNDLLFFCELLDLNGDEKRPPSLPFVCSTSNPRTRPDFDRRKDLDEPLLDALLLERDLSL